MPIKTPRSYRKEKLSPLCHTRRSTSTLTLDLHRNKKPFSFWYWVRVNNPSPLLLPPFSQEKNYNHPIVFSKPPNTRHKPRQESNHNHLTDMVEAPDSQHHSKQGSERNLTTTTSLSPYVRNTPKQKKGVATTLWLQPLCKQNLSLVERYSLQRVIKGISQTYQVLQYSAQQAYILASMLFRNGHEPSYSLPSASKQSRGYCLLRECHQPYEDD